MRDVSSWEIVIYADKKPQSSALNTTLISLVLRQKDKTLRYNCSRNDAPLRIDPLAILVESIHHQANHLMPSWRLQFFPSLTFFSSFERILRCAFLNFIRFFRNSKTNTLRSHVSSEISVFVYRFFPEILFLSRLPVSCRNAPIYRFTSTKQYCAVKWFNVVSLIIEFFSEIMWFRLWVVCGLLKNLF